MSDAAALLLFGVLPYVAVAIGVAVTVERLRRRPFDTTSHSSQFLENGRHFWALLPFHYGLFVVLASHFVAMTAPGWVLAWNATPARLLAVETFELVFAWLALAGLVLVIVRRASARLVRPITSAGDWVVYLLLLVQVADGIYMAVTETWGSSWFAAVLTPYLWSLARLDPQVSAVAVLPRVVQVHVIGAFLLVAVFPYSRLFHLLAAPIPYVWRRPQVVRWPGIRTRSGPGRRTV